MGETKKYVHCNLEKIPGFCELSNECKKWTGSDSAKTNGATFTNFNR